MQDLTKVVWHGTVLSEEFTWGFWLGPVAWADVDELQTAVNSYVTNCLEGSWFSPLLVNLSKDSYVDTVTFYHYADTQQPATYSAQGTIGAAQGVGTSNYYTPLQQSLVATLRTNRSGASYRGRMYLPANGMSLSAGHAVANGVCTQYATFGAEIILAAMDVANAAGHSDVTGLVYSATKGIATPVDRVSVDNRPDIQRRRAESQAVTFVASYDAHA